MYSVVIASAGSGSRLNLGYNKLFYKVQGVSILELTVNNFLNIDEFDEVIIVHAKEDLETIQKMNFNNNHKIKYILGSDTRQKSVKNGILNAINEYVFVHDGARCFISDSILRRCINEVQKSKLECYAVAVSCVDSVHEVENGYIKKILNRDLLYSMQTPQIVNKDIILKYYENDIVATDEAGLFYLSGGKVKIIEGDYKNIKITNEKDLGVFNGQL